ncbi:hypothetical protein N7465_011415 [Penicillium sp. CMV-2018d]|nr:hypothetical protein N7465_011415 [Penicillium sp. CMV-2018d]
MTSNIELEWRLQKSLVSPPSILPWRNHIRRRSHQANFDHTTQNSHINRLIQVAEYPTAAPPLDDEPSMLAFHIKAAI